MRQRPPNASTAVSVAGRHMGFSNLGDDRHLFLAKQLCQNASEIACAASAKVYMAVQLSCRSSQLNARKRVDALRPVSSAWQQQLYSYVSTAGILQDFS